MSTGHDCFAFRPAGGSELRPTVAQPPALATGAAKAATASTSRSFFMRILQSGVSTRIHRTGYTSSLLDRLGELERLGPGQVAFEPE